VPTYQYACTECGERLEVVQRFSDDPLTVCAACGGKLRKVFSPVGIVFKGSGFYRNDSRSGAVAAGASNGKADADGSSSSSDGSSAKAESGAKSEGAGSGTKSGSDGSSGGNGSGKVNSGTGSAGAGSSGTSSKVA